MLKAKHFLFCTAVLFLQAYLVHSFCSEKKGLNGSISDYFTIDGGVKRQGCWRIQNPEKNIIHLNLKEFKIPRLLPKTESIEACNLTIALLDERRNITFWSFNSTGNITTTTSVLEIYFQVLSVKYPNNLVASFTLHYRTEPGMGNIEDARSMVITWLRNQRSPLLDWRENSLKAMIALYLSGNATFDGTNLREELKVRRAEGLISRALKSNITVSEIDLSMFVNFLRVTCISPRHFQSQNLVQMLKSRLDSPRNFTHPTVYLALCNANETWPRRAATDLKHILTSESEYFFLKDLQLFALMAISCRKNQVSYSTSAEFLQLDSIYRANITNVKKKQLSDGSFGNIHETALAVQTLMSSGEDFVHSNNWNIYAAVKYVTRKLNSSEIDFQAAYLSLPILNKMTLIDIAKRNCTGNPRNNEDILVADYTGSKIEVPNDHVRYSLFIGDKKELIRTITFRIPNNFTAYQVMQMAEVQNEKFKFQWKRESGKIYVKEISQIPNNPEDGKFWLLHLGSNSQKPLIPYFNKGPDEILMKHGDHLIMWYKTVAI